MPSKLILKLLPRNYTKYPPKLPPRIDEIVPVDPREKSYTLYKCKKERKSPRLRSEIFKTLTLLLLGDFQNSAFWKSSGDLQNIQNILSPHYRSEI